MRAQKDFTANIPIPILERTDLKPQVKLLYGVINSMERSNYKVIYATNTFFAKIFHVDERTIQRWLKILEQKGLIKRTMRRFSTKKVVRYIQTVGRTSNARFCLVPYSSIRDKHGASALIIGWLQTCTRVTKKRETQSLRRLARRLGLTRNQILYALKFLKYNPQCYIEYQPLKYPTVFSTTKRFLRLAMLD